MQDDRQTGTYFPQPVWRVYIPKLMDANIRSESQPFVIDVIELCQDCTGIDLPSKLPGLFPWLLNCRRKTRD
jgi:hypothetical protein